MPPHLYTKYLEVTTILHQNSVFIRAASFPFLSDKPDFYNGCDLRFVDGSCGVINKITGYDGSAGINYYFAWD